MSGTKLTPEKITSPFQLMAAWFAMLVLLVTILLAAAAKITQPDWIPAYLVIFTSVLILVVVACVLLMLTRFRPHLQDGDLYANWLKDRDGYQINTKQVGAPSIQLVQAQQLPASIKREITKRVQEPVNLVASLADIDGASELKALLVKQGFPSEIYVAPRNSDPASKPADHEAIWIGKRVPPSTAISIMKLAIEHWPHLKYLHLSGDKGDPPDYVHDQIFLGGSSNTALEYGLIPWSNEEITALDPQLSLSVFHRNVRKRYG